MHIPATYGQETLHDPLTGAASLELLAEVGNRMLGLARRYGRWMGVLHVRLGGVADVLDALSEQEQDTLLRRIARRLDRCLRETDVVARIDGERFAVVLSDLWEPESCASVAMRLLQELSTVRVPGRHRFADVRIGATLFPDDGDDLDVLLYHAEAACDRVHGVTPSLEFYDIALGARLKAGVDIVEAMERGPDRSQMFLAFQPIFSLDGNRLVGAEALSRWQHPTRGTLAAVSFIPQAESTGRIRTIDRWALKSALARVHGWRRDGWNGWVSVNMSARSFASTRFVPLVLTTLRNEGLDADALVIEVTESQALAELPAAAEAIGELHEHGIRVAIDDFGTGYASFRYVSELDASLVKIDRSFLLAAEREPRHARLLESMIQMAHHMDKPVISEGVETQGQRDRLAAADCDYMQGWLAGEAIEASRFQERWL